MSLSEWYSKEVDFKPVLEIVKSDHSLLEECLKHQDIHKHAKVMFSRGSDCQNMSYMSLSSFGGARSICFSKKSVC